MAWLLGQLIRLLTDIASTGAGILQQLKQLNEKGEHIVSVVDDLVTAQSALAAAVAAILASMQTETDELKLVVTELQAQGTDTTKIQSVIGNMTGITDALTAAAKAASDATAAAKAADPNTPPAPPAPPVGS